MKLILFNVDEDLLTKIKKIIDIDYSVINDDYLDYTIEQLCSLDVIKYQNNGFPVALFNDIKKDLMFDYIDKLAELDKDFIFAGVIENNKSWKLRELLEELVLEHEVYKRYGIINGKLEQVKDISKYNLEEKKVLMEAYVCLQEYENDLNKLDDVINKLENIF